MPVLDLEETQYNVVKGGKNHSLKDSLHWKTKMEARTFNHQNKIIWDYILLMKRRFCIFKQSHISKKEKTITKFPISECFFQE